MRTEMKLSGGSLKEISKRNMQGRLHCMRRCAGFMSPVHALYTGGYVQGASHDICVTSGVAIR